MTSGLLDTSVVIDWHDPIVVAALPDEMAISAITAAELAAGPHLAATPADAAKRLPRLQETKRRSWSHFRFDGTAVRSYGLVVAAVVRRGASHVADSLTCSRRNPTRQQPRSLHTQRP